MSSYFVIKAIPWYHYRTEQDVKKTASVGELPESTNSGDRPLAEVAEVVDSSSLEHACAYHLNRLCWEENVQRVFEKIAV
ncbi:hypothetical protein KQX54_018745 [Cotesia glomerata]|uniref:Uncharacterized protein n=1 Tax=Cotesia glomerata TaxID=32391 RepID=A0AAV7IB61_COTGL|nr:hypothetical protein KQX54_018745 [Cotesia glomerata]